MLSLPHLKSLSVIAQPVHTILLNHLLIPTGASLKQKFSIGDDGSPISAYIPQTLKNFENLSLITSTNLCFDSGISLRHVGPSGALYVFSSWVGADPSPPAANRRVFRFLMALFSISTTERLAIAKYRDSPPTKIEKSFVYLTLLLTNNPRVLTLTDCANLPFILALNPKQNASGTIVCPKLEGLVLYIANEDWFCVNQPLEMAKERASSGAKLSTITVVCFREFVPATEVLKLRNHASRVEYRLDDVEPEWDAFPADVKDSDCESEW